MDSNRNVNKANRVVRTRNRIPRSCTGCRTRKLKCNREKPACQNCLARSEGGTCTYDGGRESSHASLGGGNGLGNSTGVKDGRIGESPRPSSTTMRNRIDRLESLILSMVSEDQGSSSQKSSHTLGHGDGPDSMTSEDGVSVARNGFSGSCNSVRNERYDDSEVPRKAMEITSIHSQNTHWDTILQDIATIKDIWIQDYETQDLGARKPDVPVKHRPGLMEGLTPSPSIAEIVSSLPAKTGTDKLVARLYDSYNPGVPTKPIIHRQTFLKQYQQFWNDPLKVSPGWLSLLFSMICFTVQTYSDDNAPSEFQGRIQELCDLYRTRTVQCLRIADINKPSEYVLQALLFYNLTDYVRSKDSKIAVWIMNGIIIRLAVAQEFHRDPDHDPSINPFRGEIRRRLWGLIWDGDLLFSHQTGSPRMFHHSDSDTKYPSNLHEEELYEDMKELPLSRPLTEPTQIAYNVCKIKLVRVFGQIAEQVHSLLPDQPYSNVLDLDRRMNEAHDEVAPHLKMRPITQMIGESSALIMERFILEILFQKGKCILHRQHLSASYTDDSLIYSRKICVQSAMKLLEAQATLHEESHPAGLMPSANMSWWSISTHDFLMAAMVICVDLVLCTQHIPQSLQPSPTSPTSHESQAQILALENARKIWQQMMDRSTDARKAVSILTQMLEKVKGAKRGYGGGVGDVRVAYKGVGNEGFKGGMVLVECEGRRIEITRPADSPPLPMQLDGSNGNGVSQFASLSESASVQQQMNQLDGNILADMSFYGDGFSVGFDSAAVDWAAWDEFLRDGPDWREQNGNGNGNGNGELGFTDFIL